MSDLTCCLFPEAGAGPALPIAARDHGHDPDQNLTPQEGGAGPGLAAPLLRKLLFVYFSFYLDCSDKYHKGYFSHKLSALNISPIVERMTSRFGNSICAICVYIERKYYRFVMAL